MMGEVSTLETKPTAVFNNEIMRFRKYGRKYEFWDPSGDDNYIQFWESLYKNIAFDIVVFVVDARRYWSKETRVQQVVLDRHELHTLLCAVELDDCQFVIYLNWKTELDLGDEKNMMEVIPDELELYNFPKRDIVVVDTFKNLCDCLMSLPLQNEQHE